MAKETEWAKHSLELVEDGNVGEAYESIRKTLPYLKGKGKRDANQVMETLRDGDLGSAASQLRGILR